MKRSWWRGRLTRSFRRRKPGTAAMFLARVVGHVVSTHKVASMVGWKLLAVEPLR
ncbi:MAG: EutN/CcmL family microcompartment protein, partial [Planctomycetia bacterium]